MLKIQVKQLVNGKWIPVEAKEYIGMSIADWLLKADKVCVAALFDNNDRPQVFITNSAEWRKKFDTKGFVFTVEEFKSLAGTTFVSPVIIKTFGEECGLYEVKSHKEEDYGGPS